MDLFGLCQAICLWVCNGRKVDVDIPFIAEVFEPFDVEPGPITCDDDPGCTKMTFDRLPDEAIIVFPRCTG